MKSDSIASNIFPQGFWLFKIIYISIQNLESSCQFLQTNPVGVLSGIPCSEQNNFGRIDVSEIEPSDCWMWCASLLFRFWVYRNCKYIIKLILKYLIFSCKWHLNIWISNCSFLVYRNTIGFYTCHCVTYQIQWLFF